MRQAIKSAKVAVNNLSLAVTASFGVSLNGVVKTIETMLQEADLALYQAKHAGGNRVLALSALSGGHLALLPDAASA